MKKSTKPQIENPTEEPNEQLTGKNDFDEMLHKLLIIGLVISVLLMLTGLALALIKHEQIPTTIPPLTDLFSQIKSLQASGFLALGILVLIATPIVRVISSLIAFLIERDWRFAGVTLIVLITVTISILTGNH